MERATVPEEHLLPFEREGAVEDSVEGAANDLFDLLESEGEAALENPGSVEPEGDAEEDAAESIEEVLDEEDEPEELDEVETTDEESDDTEETEDEEVTDEDEDEEEAAEEELVFEWEDEDGNTQRLTLEELEQGQLRQADYTKKTQELAEERKQTEAERESLQQARQEYAQRLELAQQVIEQSVPEEPDWEKLRKENPGEYAALRADYDAHQRDLQTLQAERQRVHQEQVQAWQEKHVEAKKEMRETLKQTVSEWDSDEKLLQGLEEIETYAVDTYGWAPQQLGAVTDPNIVVALRKAMLYDRLENEEKPKVRKKTKKAKVLKPGGRARKGTKRKASEKKKRAKLERARKTGRVDHAAAAIADLID